MWKVDHVWAVDAKRQIRFTGVRSLPSLATNQCQFVCPHTCLAVVYSMCLPVVVVLVDVVLKYPVSFASACWEEWTGNINAVSESTLWNSEVFLLLFKSVQAFSDDSSVFSTVCFKNTCQWLLRAFRAHYVHIYMHYLILKIYLNNLVIMHVFSSFIQWVFQNVGFLL